MTVVLDSWMILRYLEDVEPGAGNVARLIETERPVVSWINLGEVFSVVRRLSGEDAASEVIRDLREITTPDTPTETRVIEAARLKAEYRMAYADAFAAATTVSHAATLWTGDPELLLEGAPWAWRDLRH